MGGVPCFRRAGEVVNARDWLYKRRRQGRQHCVRSSKGTAIDKKTDRCKKISSSNEAG